MAEGKSGFSLFRSSSKRRSNKKLNDSNREPKTFVRVDLRIDQRLDEADKYKDDTVQIFAPGWVKEGLQRLSNNISFNSKFLIEDSTCDRKELTFNGENGLSLKALLILARNDQSNNNGVINFDKYQQVIKSSEMILSIKDLARQCVIAARDFTTHYGGFCYQRVSSQHPAIVLDLAALQFNQNYNTGRLVIIGKDLPKGVLDDFIFYNVVGERKKSYREILEDDSGRYIPVKRVFFDSLAYQRFVANDFYLAADAANRLAEPDEGVNFKFLKYGTGKFACAFRTVLEEYINHGVLIGINLLFKNIPRDQLKIRNIELPFFKRDSRIEKTCQSNGIGCTFGQIDALSPTFADLVIATSNCSDPHSPPGNEMEMKSIHSAIAANLQRQANQMNPAINLLMKERFVNFDRHSEFNVSQSKIVNLNKKKSKNKSRDRKKQHKRPNSLPTEGFKLYGHQLSDPGSYEQANVKKHKRPNSVGSQSNKRLSDQSNVTTPKTLQETIKKFAIVFLRHDQELNLRDDPQYQDSRIKIVAPKWVEEALKLISNAIPTGSGFRIIDKNNKKIERPIGRLTLKELAILARNDPFNVTGEINLDNYKQIIQDKQIIYSIKDLIRQTVTVGPDIMTHIGGYKCSRRQVEEAEVFIIDLVGLQFQQPYNSGRLVINGKDIPKGFLDDLIFEKVVGEKKLSYEEVKNIKSERYLPMGRIFFDTLAYRRFVANDLLLAATAINTNVNENREIHLKFLKYGTGFFAGQYTSVLNDLITEGVADGLKLLGENIPTGFLKIRTIELPFFPVNKRLQQLAKLLNIECLFTDVDALDTCYLRRNRLLATTNCADPHAMPGNEMRFQSVDAAVAENLVSRANKFNPVINSKMECQFVELVNSFPKGQPVKRKKSSSKSGCFLM